LPGRPDTSAGVGTAVAPLVAAGSCGRAARGGNRFGYLATAGRRRTRSSPFLDHREEILSNSDVPSETFCPPLRIMRGSLTKRAHGHDAVRMTAMFLPLSRLFLLLLLGADWLGDPYFGKSPLSRPYQSQDAFCHSLAHRVTLLKACHQDWGDLHGIHETP